MKNDKRHESEMKFIGIVALLMGVARVLMFLFQSLRIFRNTGLGYILMSLFDVAVASISVIAAFYYLKNKSFKSGIVLFVCLFITGIGMIIKDYIFLEMFRFFNVELILAIFMVRYFKYLK